jgi:hypothetical protein
LRDRETHKTHKVRKFRWKFCCEEAERRKKEGVGVLNSCGFFFFFSLCKNIIPEVENTSEARSFEVFWGLGARGKSVECDDRNNFASRCGHRCCWHKR